MYYPFLTARAHFTRKKLELQSHLNKRWHSFMVITKYRATIFKDSFIISLSQYFKNHYKSVATWESNLKFWTIALTTDTHQVLKNHISVPANYLIEILHQNTTIYTFFSCKPILLVVYRCIYKQNQI